MEVPGASDNRVTQFGLSMIQSLSFFCPITVQIYICEWILNLSFPVVSNLGQGPKNIDNRY
jgi:hypothetical protein